MKAAYYNDDDRDSWTYPYLQHETYRKEKSIILYDAFILFYGRITRSVLLSHVSNASSLVISYNMWSIEGIVFEFKLLENLSFAYRWKMYIPRYKSIFLNSLENSLMIIVNYWLWSSRSDHSHLVTMIKSKWPQSFIDYDQVEVIIVIYWL